MLTHSLLTLVHCTAGLALGNSSWPGAAAPSCRQSAFDLICFLVFLHLPDVPQPLIVKPYAEFQRRGGRWRINKPVSGCCEEEPGAVNQLYLMQTSKSHPPLGSTPPSSQISLWKSRPASLPGSAEGSPARPGAGSPRR